jgi:hypothetical protein
MNKLVDYTIYAAILILVCANGYYIIEDYKEAKQSNKTLKNTLNYEIGCDEDIIMLDFEEGEII